MQIWLKSVSIWRNRSSFVFFAPWRSSLSQFAMLSTGKFIIIRPVIAVKIEAKIDRWRWTVEHRMIAGIWSSDSMMFSAESLSEQKNAFSLKPRQVLKIGSSSSLKWLRSAAWSLNVVTLIWLVSHSISNFDPPNSRLIGSNWPFIHSHLFSIGKYPK